MRLLNCGCGNKYVVDDNWINVDFRSDNKDVCAANLLKGLPFDKESFDVVFTSNMLEHFSRKDAKKFLLECNRVLCMNGIIRIVVPDLENICREYLRILDTVRNNPQYGDKYEYIVIELLDQMTRRSGGGEMLSYWEQNIEREYVKMRTGFPADYNEKNSNKANIIKKILSKLELYQKCREWKYLYSGEAHLWMYDSYSLSKIMVECGFEQPMVMMYNKSKIKEWESYRLEVNADGTEYKPNNLYVEAIKKTL